MVGKAFESGEIQGERVREGGKGVHSVETHTKFVREKRERKPKKVSGSRESQDPACQKHTRVMLPPI